MIDGVEHLIPAATQGAIPWSTFVLLRQMELERNRPTLPAEGQLAGPAQRLSIVILFWTLFEILMDGFYRAALADLPGELDQELLQRFPGIGGRLDRLYHRMWGTTYWSDLEAEGFAEDAVLLRLVQSRRNAFVHGNPEAIDDGLVQATLTRLESVQLGWIALFNKRCTGRIKRVAMWEVDRRRT